MDSFFTKHYISDLSELEKHTLVEAISSNNKECIKRLLGEKLPDEQVEMILATFTSINQLPTYPKLVYEIENISCVRLFDFCEKTFTNKDANFEICQPELLNSFDIEKLDKKTVSDIYDLEALINDDDAVLFRVELTVNDKRLNISIKSK